MMTPILPWIMTALAILTMPPAALGEEAKPVAAPLVGQVTVVSGLGKVLRGDTLREEALTKGLLVAVGDSLITGSSGRAKVVLLDGSVLSLGSDSRLTALVYVSAEADEPHRLEFRLPIGAVRTTIDQQAMATDVGILTSAAAASGRPADWIIEASPDVTAVVALWGTVRVAELGESLDDGVTLRAHEATTVRPSEAPAPAHYWSQRRVARSVAATAAE